MDVLRREVGLEVRLQDARMRCEGTGVLFPALLDEIQPPLLRGSAQSRLQGIRADFLFGRAQSNRRLTTTTARQDPHDLDQEVHATVQAPQLSLTGLRDGLFWWVSAPLQLRSKVSISLIRISSGCSYLSASVDALLHFFATPGELTNMFHGAAVVPSHSCPLAALSS